MNHRAARLFPALLVATGAFAAAPGGLPEQANPRARDATGGVPEIAIQTIRLDETAGAYAFAVVIGLNNTKKDPPPALRVAPPTLEVEGRVLELQDAGWERHASTEVRVGVGRGLRAVLTLTDAAGDALWSGTAPIADGSLSGAWSGTWQDGDAPADFGVDAVRLHPTGTRGVMGLSFTLHGGSALEVSGGDLLIYDDTARVPVYEATLTADDLDTTRTWTAPVRFDGDPTNSAYAVSSAFVDANGVTGTAAGTIEVVRLPGDASAPGPLLGVFQGGFGNGYVPPSTQPQTQQTQLL